LDNDICYVIFLFLHSWLQKYVLNIVQKWFVNDVRRSKSAKQKKILGYWVNVPYLVSRRSLSRLYLTRASLQKRHLGRYRVPYGTFQTVPSSLSHKKWQAWNEPREKFYTHGNIVFSACLFHFKYPKMWKTWSKWPRRGCIM
jgi:hypothetical protein